MRGTNQEYQTISNWYQLRCFFWADLSQLLAMVGSLDPKMTLRKTRRNHQSQSWTCTKSITKTRKKGCVSSGVIKHGNGNSPINGGFHRKITFPNGALFSKPCWLPEGIRKWCHFLRISTIRLCRRLIGLHPPLEALGFRETRLRRRGFNCDEMHFFKWSFELLSVLSYVRIVQDKSTGWSSWRKMAHL